MGFSVGLYCRHHHRIRTAISTQPCPTYSSEECKRTRQIFYRPIKMCSSLRRTQSWLGSSLSFNHNALSSESSHLTEIHSMEQWKTCFKTSKESSQLMVIYFTAKWCGPCHAMEPAINELVSSFAGVQFVKIDIDELLAVAKEFEVQVVPTFILLKQGKEVDKVAGTKKDELHNKIQMHKGLKLQYA